MSIQHHFILPNPKDAIEAASLGPPNLMGLSPSVQIDAIIHWCSRKLWTGINYPPLTGQDETIGLHVLRWFKSNEKLNQGLGPAVSCGTLAHACIGLLAAYGIYARLLVSVNRQGSPDHTIEVFQDPGWAHYIPHLNAHFRSISQGQRLSYWQWSSAARSGNADKFEFYSPTGGWPTLPALDYFRDSYVASEFTRAAVVSNGNRVFIDGNDSDLELLQVWRDPENLLPEWNKGIDASIGELYPSPVL